ncbi:MAG TPA: PilZ domain-containing protein [Candidatus Krumholzibacteria bacterium]|nr:PilZ domain-containing protein [Candidatus Krumholzibacteria bacterium]HPD70496.1 PilZ domain-containing protein [Candidatus Krumholzibacteria bacterium]HRY39804.1 PilZ domain-containing protein [Candidatus Krumholzibacteria bacterium]
MQKHLTENLHAICRAVLNALARAVPGELLACDLVQIDHREFHFQAVAAAHFPGGPVRRLLLGCEERLAEHFATALGAPAGTGSPDLRAGLEMFCRSVQFSLADSGLPWAGDQDFVVHDHEQFRVQCDGVRNFLFRAAVAEGRLDLIIDLAPRILGCEWLQDEIARGGRTQVGAGEASITERDVIRRIMCHLAEAGADVEIKVPGEGDRLELLQATFLSRAAEVDGERLSLTCARRTSLESADDIPEKVTLVFILQDKLLQCTCQVLDHGHVWLDDDIALPTLELAYPDAVTYGQRRGAFRLEPPERLTGTVRRVSEENSDAGLIFKRMAVRVKDVSFTGAKLHLGSNAIISGFKGGSLVECALSLPDPFGEVTLHAIVRRLHVDLDDPGRRGATLGVEFHEPEDSPALAALRRYIEDRHARRLSTGGVELKIG